jgi:hypothetical protein
LDTKQTIYERDKGRCFRCGEGIPYGEGNIHHRQAGGMGGSKKDKRKGWPSNGLLLCAGCHQHIEDHPMDSYDKGWKVRQWDEPQYMPVLRFDGWVMLTPDGQSASVPPPSL